MRITRLFLNLTIVFSGGSLHRFNTIDAQLNMFYHFNGNISWLLGASVVLWRAFALFTDNPRHRAYALAFPALTLICGLVLSFFVIWTFYAGGAFHVPYRIVYGLSFLANVISTGIIGWIAWKHRQTLRKTLGERYRRTMTEGVMLILVESGIVYIVLYIIRTIAWIEPMSPVSGLAIFIDILGPSIDQLCCLHPAAVIILVNLRQSMADGKAEVSLNLQSPGFPTTPNSRSPSDTVVGSPWSTSKGLSKGSLTFNPPSAKVEPTTLKGANATKTAPTFAPFGTFRSTPPTVAEEDEPMLFGGHQPQDEPVMQESFLQSRLESFGYSKQASFAPRGRRGPYSPPPVQTHMRSPSSFSLGLRDFSPRRPGYEPQQAFVDEQGMKLAQYAASRGQGSRQPSREDKSSHQRSDSRLGLLSGHQYTRSESTMGHARTDSAATKADSAVLRAESVLGSYDARRLETPSPGAESMVRMLPRSVGTPPGLRVMRTASPQSSVMSPLSGFSTLPKTSESIVAPLPKKGYF
ncbi:hypothetical protein CYLTODRAFT_164053 [Cylindrobasidium torrendii FP15055 ss-10]|uniref:Uncharacterized protein n=1 Tax=Cylindrobasidium torrendii FP15055 ss-10 TaxID=1314674 RepID=A0A0D7AWP5_9AGAR|nr:hypothetical protein CYLTODRAFT_164053 [Cylindrobasidium torrendii FP15055 ss-10]